ncbi:MAG TPA: alcohol dehydrogenase catalytic domain-containing protein [Candidatus Dormibacteraeota bacterium]|jgi:propanol-preferring alcohol dehydrogenase
MNALRLHSWGGDLAPEEVPEPVPRDGEVLVDVQACGVGLTVLNCIRGDLGADPANLPRIPGHEYVGTITAVGPGVDPARVGESVTAYFYLFCGRCSRCLASTEDLCENLAGFVGVDRDGGYAERVVLPERNAVRLPRGLDPVLATAIPDAIATPVHVAHRAAIRPGQRVVVIAAGGGVGIHMVQVARAYGADVVGLDIDPAKLRYLTDELAVDAADSSDFGSVTFPASWGSARPDVVVDFLGSATSLGWGLDALGVGGRLVVLTTFPGVDFPVSPRKVVFSETAVLGSRYATRHQLHLAAELVRTGRVRPVVSRREDAAGVESIHGDLRNGHLLGRGALVWQD